MAAARTCRLVTLGCKVNQYETQYLREALELNGYVEAGEGHAPDLCVVNTCTVTHEGDAKSRQAIRRLHHDHPDAAIVVMGCYATRDPDAVGKLPGVVHVVTDKYRLLDDLAPFGVTTMPAGISRFDDHQRAFVKVQDGCLLHCSFCIIPHVRPTLRSRPPDDIAAEVLRLAAEGYREVVLTGIHLGHYGIDICRGRPKREWVRLWHLVERLAGLAGEFRIRLSSLEAAEARDDLVRVLATQPRVCPHLHLCLQSGSDRILARMRRRYTSGGFLERVRRIRAALDQPALTTDIIVGFPGETDEDFEATCRVARQAGFCRIHVFSYSPRQGTAAASLPDDVPPEVKAERRRRLLQIERGLQAEYLGIPVGRRLDVLVEGPDPQRPGWVRGTSCRHMPVSFPGLAAALLRRCVPIDITAAAEGGLLGEPAPQSGVAAASSPQPPAPRRFPLPLNVEDFR
jgi:threonylcarbamoyladenosine tRNA methylthiotransferase MtaB